MERDVSMRSIPAGSIPCATSSISSGALDWMHSKAKSKLERQRRKGGSDDYPGAEEHNGEGRRQSGFPGVYGWIQYVVAAVASHRLVAVEAGDCGRTRRRPLLQ